MIDIKNLFISFTKEYDALHNINFYVSKGERVAIVGGEQSGKTTLIRVIAGLEKVQRGEVYLKGININKVDYKNDISVAYIPQTPVFLNNKTVSDNLKYTLKIRNYDEPTINYKVMSSMSAFKISNLKNIKINQLNKFQKIVVQLARASTRKIELFLIDNIFDGFSFDEQHLLRDYIKMLIEQNPEATVLLACNDTKVLGDLKFKVVNIKNGSIEKN